MEEISSPVQFNVKPKQSKFKRFLNYVARDRQLLILLIPGVLFFLIYMYVPIGGLFLGFTNYRGGNIFHVKWVGLKWFVQFFTMPGFFRLIRNTVLINLYGIIYGFAITIFFSLMLNEIRGVFYKKFVQSVSYLPYFISTVIIVGLLYNFFSVEGGVVNILLNKIGIQSIDFITSAKWFRTLYVGSGVWQGFGFSSIIYLSAITAINLELYDAADVDGANRIQRILHITLPGIYPTIVILLILNLGTLFSIGYEKIILMYTPQTYETADVLGSFIYRKGIQGSEFGFTTAIGLVQSIINIVFILFTNKIARKTTETSLW